MSLLGGQLPGRRVAASTPDLATVRSVLLVREHASFRRASDALGVNPSVLSRRILALEHSLGVALFQRDAAGARLTDAGAAFLEHAEAALTLLTRAATEAAAVGRGEIGQLRVGHAWPISSGEDRLLGAFRRGLQNVDLRLHDGSAAELVTLLLRRDLDIAFLEEPDVPPEAARLLLGAEAWRLATPADALLQDDGWPVGLPVLTVPRDAARVRRLVIERGACAVVLNPQSTSHDGLMSLVAAGVGCAIVPGRVAQRAPSAVRFNLLPGRPEPVRAMAVWLPDTSNAALRHFLDVMHDLSHDRPAAVSTTTNVAAE